MCKADVIEHDSSGNYRLKPPGDVELRSAPAHDSSDSAPSTSSNVLDSLNPAQKHFLSFLPIRDKAILGRYHTEGFYHFDEENIKDIKRTLIGAELIEFDENLETWQATKKCLELRGGV